MASKRHIRRAGCEGKRRYNTEAQADSARFYHLQMLGTNCRLNVYLCRFCDHYHLGHQKMGKTDRHNYRERRRDWIAA